MKNYKKKKISLESKKRIMHKRYLENIYFYLTQTELKHMSSPSNIHIIIKVGSTLHKHSLKHKFMHDLQSIYIAC